MRMKSLIGVFLFSICGFVFCGCEKDNSGTYDDVNSYHGANDTASITVYVENQSPRQVIVYKGDAVYAYLYPGESCSVYGYLVGKEHLKVQIGFPEYNIVAFEYFDRFDYYSNFTAFDGARAEVHKSRY